MISFIFIENKCLSDTICDLKREKKSLADGGLELGLTVSQSTHCNHYTIEADARWTPFLILDYRKHTIAIIVSKLGLVKKNL